MSQALPILYSFRRCPYAMRARLAIAVSGQRCELREIVLRDKPADLLLASPKGTVPVLVDVDGTVIDQSLDIMLWALERQDPQSWLHPPDGDTPAMMSLIASNDGQFKHHLDRTKYPERYAGSDASASRAQAARLLDALETRLHAQPWLFGDRACLADMAIVPFVRQFAHIDKAWFASQPWPGLQAWLDAVISSTLFEHVLQKFPRWSPDSPGLPFP